MMRLAALAAAILALAALGAGASAGTIGLDGSLEVACDRDSVARGVDSLLTCTYTATNDGPAAWPEAQIFFQPAAGVAIPDRYFFFSYKKEGVAEDHGPFQTNYSFGRIEPGESATIELEIIVNSNQDFGADVVLVPRAGEPPVDRHSSSFTVIDDEATLPLFYGSLVTFYEPPVDGVTPSVASMVFTIANRTDVTVDQISVDVFAPDYGVTAGIDAPTRVNDTHITGTLPAMAPGEINAHSLRIETRGQCVDATPAVVVRARSFDGETVVAPMTLHPFGITSVSMNCAVDASTLDPATLPSSGAGTVGETATSMTIGALLALGATLVAAGAFASNGVRAIR